MEIDEETRNRHRAEKETMKKAGLVKRKVAIHVGYAGTDYSGLQLSGLDHVRTIEAELQAALIGSGCISEANSVSLAKVKWSRSSRTDKGVHSLATVVALKCMIDEKAFDIDPEGLDLASYVSSFLPSDIRIFSIQRVNDGFFARKACSSRQYAYYVPLSLITGSVERLGEEEEKACLKRFREALSMFCGRHAFHNYTKRRQYINSADAWSFGRRNSAKRRFTDEAVINEDDADEDEEGAISPEDSNRETGSSYEDYQALVAMEKETGRWRFWSISFKEMNDPNDRIVAQHYRQILSFTADDPAPVVPGGVPAVCCRIHGMSFMLHQIRYMVGTAVAYARKHISSLVLEGSLKACLRINLPLALPQTLILYENEFLDFPSNPGEAPTVARWSGNRLELREGGQELQQKFCDEVLMPEIGRLLTAPGWQRWSDNLELVKYDESLEVEVREVMEKYSAWVKEKQDARAAKQEALKKELNERGIDRDSWMKARRDKTKLGDKPKRLVKPKPNPLRR